MSCSPIRTVPAVGSSRPATIRSVVVLPQPDGPSSAKNDPCGTVSVRSSTAVKSPKRLVTPSSRRSPPPASRGDSPSGVTGVVEEDEVRRRRALVELRDPLLGAFHGAEVVVPRSQLRGVHRVVVEVHQR